MTGRQHYMMHESKEFCGNDVLNMVPRRRAITIEELQCGVIYNWLVTSEDFTHAHKGNCSIM